MQVNLEYCGGAICPHYRQCSLTGFKCAPEYRYHFEEYNKLQTIFNHYGEEAQKRKLQEECAELIRAVARDDEENMLEEMADVLILIKQFCDLEHKKDIQEIMNKKIERTLKRIEAEKAPCLAADCLGCAEAECRMKV